MFQYCEVFIVQNMSSLGLWGNTNFELSGLGSINISQCCIYIAWPT